MKNIIMVVLLIIGMIVLWRAQEPRLEAYNRHMCAVYGYYEDCKTPLPDSLRLK